MNRLYPFSLSIFHILVLGVIAAGAGACSDDANREALIGVWALDRTSFPQQLELREDGTALLTRDEQTLSGSFAVDGDVLELEWISAEGSSFIHETFYVDETQLLRGAFLPVGSVDGHIGTWLARDDRGADGELTTEYRVELQVREDTRYTYTLSSPMGVISTQEGYYDPHPPSDGTIQLWADGTDFSIGYFFVPDQAIASNRWLRVE